jgi:MFS superfamily sulfate permease-like transporter
VAMSLAALVTVIAAIAFHGTAPQPDEGAAAHLWQLLMAAQVPVIAFFAFRWGPRAPRPAIAVLALQVLSALAAAAPVVWLNW